MSNIDEIVYITNTGSKYHLGRCGYLRSKNSIRLSDAIKTYSPCQKCHPPKMTNIPIQNEAVTRSSSLFENSNNSFFSNNSFLNKFSQLPHSSYDNNLNLNQSYENEIEEKLKISFDNKFEELKISNNYKLKEMEEKLTISFEKKFVDLKNSYEFKLKQMEDNFKIKFNKMKENNKIYKELLKELNIQIELKDQKINDLHKYNSLQIENLTNNVKNYQEDIIKKYNEQEEKLNNVSKKIDVGFVNTEIKFKQVEKSVTETIKDFSEQINLVMHNIDKNKFPSIVNSNLINTAITSEQSYFDCDNYYKNFNAKRNYLLTKSTLNKF